MRHLERPARLRDIAEASQELGAAPGGITIALVDWNRLKIVNGGQLILRRLQVHEMGHACFAVEPVSGRRLPGTGQGRECIVCNVGLRQSRTQREGAMRRYQKGWFGERLLNRHISNARYALHRGGYLVRIDHVDTDVAPDDLY